MNLKLLILMSMTPLAISCITGNSSSRPDFEPSKVIERVGSVDETPAWSNGTKATYEEAGNVIFINTISMSGNTRPEACTRASSEFGREQIVRHIKEAVSVSGQVSETSGDADPAIDALTAILAQRSLSGVKVQERYWEKREESDASGERILRMHCASKVAISKVLLQKQLKDAIEGSNINTEMKKTLQAKQMEFFENLESQNNVESTKSE